MNRVSNIVGGYEIFKVSKAVIDTTDPFLSKRRILKTVHGVSSVANPSEGDKYFLQITEWNPT